ncbi:cytochrome c peroxidase [Salicola sp. Rm-C-2C1-2]|uniref:cytochrome-c peroxidase n=1 Tax=Salicola sp. Rm-C-2C1-2 TaxID=3141321 RepID=UPI0032E42BE1
MPAEVCLSLPEDADAEELRRVYSQPKACWPEPYLADDVVHKELGLLPEMTYPEDNPWSEAKEELGKHLFFDPRLSGSEQIACANCHDPDLGWGDGRESSFGHDRQRGDRNAQTLINAGYHEHVLWDGAAESLEDQSLIAVASEIEMNAAPGKAADRLQRLEGYRERFKAVFGDAQVTKQEMAKALATFVRTVTSRESDFDRFLKGDSDQLDEAELRGLHKFRTKGRCMNCHSGPLLSDGKFHNIGLHFYGRRREDLGRYKITGDPEDVGAFRTPSLRDVTQTGPWMHNGLFMSLDSVLNMYSAGGARPEPREAFEDDPLFPETSELLKPLDLTERDKDDIEAFLGAISKHPIRLSPPERIDE